MIGSSNDCVSYFENYLESNNQDRLQSTQQLVISLPLLQVV